MTIRSTITAWLARFRARREEVPPAETPTTPFAEEVSALPDRILIISPDCDIGAVVEHIKSATPLPEGAHYEDFKTWFARGRVEDCTCGILQCVCPEARRHQEGCFYRKALLCPISIYCECPNNLDTCPTCYACTCGAGARPTLWHGTGGPSFFEEAG